MTAVKLSRSEFLVLRETLRSKGEGLSNKELAMALKGKLSDQGLADALKGLQSKALVYRDAMSKSKIKGAHALYKSTATSSEELFLNEVAEFVLSEETATIPLSVTPAPFATATCLYPSASLASEATDPFSALIEDEDLGRRLWDVAQCITSTWLDYRGKNYNEGSLKVVGEYEEALATYLWLFHCHLRRWAPGATNELRDGPCNYVDPLDMVLSSHSIDWLLEKYHISEEGLERRHKNFPNTDDGLGRLGVEGLRGLKAIVFNRRKKRIYEEYLKSLVPPKTLMLLDFGSLMHPASVHP